MYSTFDLRWTTKPKTTERGIPIMYNVPIITIAPIFCKPHPLNVPSNPNNHENMSTNHCSIIFSWICMESKQWSTTLLQNKTTSSYSTVILVWNTIHIWNATQIFLLKYIQKNRQHSLIQWIHMLHKWWTPGPHYAWHIGQISIYQYKKAQRVVIQKILTV
jgi:hypothetical protein